MNPLFCPVSGGSNAGESLVPLGLGRSDERQLPISNPEWRKGHYAYCAFCRIFTNGFNTLKAMGQDSAVGCAGPGAGAPDEAVLRKLPASFARGAHPGQHELPALLLRQSLSAIATSVITADSPGPERPSSCIVCGLKTTRDAAGRLAPDP